MSAEETTARQIGRYQLLGEVGRGGMGTVYRAHDPNLDRVVALKVPHGLSANKERFQREARAAARVFHPNVCPIFDVGEHQGEPFVVMAFVEGQSLKHFLESGATLPVPDAVRVAVEVLEALAAVHAAGIVHRDVKPGNVLIDRGGRVMLTDFGLAMPQGGSHVTSEGVIVGTPAYLAPEQAAGKSDEVGPPADLYAVGVLLFRMLAGRVPFDGTPAEVVAAVLRDEPPSPRQYRPDVDLTLEAIVLTALAKKPSERFPDAAAFAAALTAYGGTFRTKKAAETTTQLEHAEAQKPATPGGVGWVRLLGWAAALTLAALVGLLQAYWVHEIWWGVDGENAPWRFLQGLTTVGSVALLMLPLLLLWLAELYRWPAGVRLGAKNRKAWIVRAAAESESDLDEPNELGDTALMIASALGHEEEVKLLLLNGARVDRVNSFGQTAAAVAAANGQGAIYDLLQRAAQAPRPARPPARRTPPRVILLLLAALLVGSLAYVVLAWRDGAWPTRLEWEQAKTLLGPDARAKGVVRSVVVLDTGKDARGKKHRPKAGVYYPDQHPDVWCEVADPSQHPALPGGRFITTPPRFASAAEEEQAMRGISSANHTSNLGWPPRAPDWWPVLVFAHAGLLALLLWLFGLGRLFWLVPRRAA